MMAGGAFFDIHITGKGAHGARPESGIDPVVVSAHIIAALQTIVARNVAPVDTAVLSITHIHAGDAYNVIPQTAQLGGTARAFSRPVMAQLEAGIRRVAQGVADALGASADGRLPRALRADDQRRPRSGLRGRGLRRAGRCRAGRPLRRHC